MSDPNTESAPAQSTAEIIRGVVESSEAESAPVETHAESTPTETPAPPQEELSPAAKFLLEKGHKPVKEDGRPVWLPHKSAAKLLDEYVNQHRSTWDSDRARIEKERDQFKADLDELYAGVRAPDTKQFLQLVAKHDPRYAVYLQEQKPAAPAITAAEDPEPGPDLDLGDGRLTYSLDGLKKLRAWERRQYQREIDEKLKPFHEREEAQKKREEEDQWNRTQQQRVQSEMATLQAMPLFGAVAADKPLTEFQAAVLKVLQDDTAKAQADPRHQKITVKEAYWEVAGKQLMETDQQKRERLMKEMDEAAKAAPPTVTRPSSGQPKKGPTDNRSIVARIVANSEKGA